MSSYLPDREDSPEALEREVEAQAEAAKRAIREYKQTICREPVSAAQHIEQQRDVSQAVSRYIQLRRRLDELHADASTSRERLVPLATGKT
jgi:hypothetical protein